jgi:hypothetical protein
MTAYTVISNSDIDQDSPVTQELVTALRDNPLAIAEGAPGAPKVSKFALGGLLLGSFSASGSNWAGLTGLGAIEEIAFNWYGGKSSSVTYPIQVSIRFTNDGGATWGAEQVLISKSSSAQQSNLGSGFSHINLKTGEKNSVGYLETTTGLSVENVTALTVPLNCDGFQIRSINTALNGFAAICFATKGR